MYIHKLFDGLILVKLESRFRRPLLHHVFIEFEDDIANEDKPGVEKIRGYYCSCQVGARVLGACSHVTAVLWFLGLARHEGIEDKSRDYLALLLDAAERTSNQEHVTNEAGTDDLDEEGNPVGEQCREYYAQSVMIP